MSRAGDAAHGKVQDLLLQPFRGPDLLVCEKRKPDGSLDFSDPQPPREWIGGVKFDDVYAAFFRSKEGKHLESASWEELLEWLDARGWKLREKTW